MVREIVKDVIFLGQKSTDATVADIKTNIDFTTLLLSMSRKMNSVILYRFLLIFVKNTQLSPVNFHFLSVFYLQN